MSTSSTSMPPASDPVALHCLARASFAAGELVRDHPPRLHNPLKRLVYELACPPGSQHQGTISATRWQAAPLPLRMPSPRSARLTARPDLFTYQPAPAGRNAVEWHVNFADPELFFGYGGSLFAQDELQVAEHPVLASVREALYALEFPARTESGGQPTPVLVTGAERRCAIATEPNAAAGRPYGLYGNQFRAASPEAVRRAVTRLEPPTITHIIAMAAPAGGQGVYTTAEIERILTTAVTGFAAARHESRRLAAGSQAEVVVHTGWWGCGAFGGSRQLMALLQIFAAEIAGIDELVFHAVSQAGVDILAEAAAAAGGLCGSALSIPMAEAISTIAARGYRWGAGNGT